jgi:hypothetical protein
MAGQLSDVHRRALANLSIPRNADDLANNMRPYVNQPAVQVDDMLRNGLSDNHWVINLGRHTEPAQLASLVQRKNNGGAGPMELPDEKAEIYARRMTRPDLAWRLDGDLWMLTNEGLAELHAIPDDAPGPMVPSAVQAAIDFEWERCYKGHPDGLLHPDLKLGGAFESEKRFLDWAVNAAGACEDTWNVRPRLPMAGGASGYSDAYEISILDCENQKTTLTAAAPWFMALSILAFTDADTGTTADNGSHIPVYTTYSRASVAAGDMAAGSGTSGSVSNTTAITFAACTAGGPATVVAFGNTSAATVGTLRKWGDCASTTISTTQTPATFAIGAYTTTVT